jgi:hypothetical protein
MNLNIFLILEERNEVMYRKLALMFHPDKGGDIEVMKKVNAAKTSGDWNTIEQLYNIHILGKKENLRDYQSYTANKESMWQEVNPEDLHKEYDRMRRQAYEEKSKKESIRNLYEKQRRWADAIEKEFNGSHPGKIMKIRLALAGEEQVIYGGIMVNDILVSGMIEDLEKEHSFSKFIHRIKEELRKIYPGEE